MKAKASAGATTSAKTRAGYCPAESAPRYCGVKRARRWSREYLPPDDAT
jgi:hypothetical protein